MLAFNQSWQVCWSIPDNPDLSQWKPKPFTRAQITGPDCGNQRRVSFSVSSSASSLSISHEPASILELKYLYSIKKSVVLCKMQIAFMFYKPASEFQWFQAELVQLSSSFWCGILIFILNLNAFWMWKGHDLSISCATRCAFQTIFSFWYFFNPIVSISND